MNALLSRLFVVMVILGALPGLAAAQSLAGTVRDTSGAVLPGVTIEASSPALITKVRTGVTDDTGQYRIPDLPPGTYKVTFTLPGFATVVREGLELSGGGVMTIGAEMRVGGLEESITVTGESPVVDVQTARQQMTIDGDIVRALPASRSYGNYIAAIPAIQATLAGSGASTINNFFSARGGRSTEGLIQLDGMNVGAPGNGGGVSGYLYDMSNSAEVQVAISGGLGEADRGGPAFNIIPKTGGNTFSGTGFISYAGEWGQSSNIDDHLRSLGHVRRAAGAHQELRRQPRHRRTDSARPRVVLREHTRHRHLPGAAEPVRQPERGRSERLDVGESRQPERPQLHIQDAQRRASDVAGHAKEQVRVLHRLHEELQRRRLRGRRRPVPRSGRRLGGVRPWRDSGHGHGVARVWQHLGRAGEDHAGVVDVAVLESPAPRKRLFGVLYRERRPSALWRADGLHSGAPNSPRVPGCLSPISSIAASIPRRRATRSTPPGGARCPTSRAATT